MSVKVSCPHCHQSDMMHVDHGDTVCGHCGFRVCGETFPETRIKEYTGQVRIAYRGLVPKYLEMDNPNASTND